MRAALIPRSPALGLLSLLLGACTAIPYDDSNHVQFAPVTDTPSSAAVHDTQSVSSVSCPLLNADAANSMTTYKSAAYGMSFTFPSNNHWGYATGTMPPFEVQGSMGVDGELAYVEFGAPVVFAAEEAHDCTPVHAYMLTILPARSAAATASSVEGADSPITPTTQTRVINSLTVVQYTEAGTHPNPTMEVMGTKYNYRFATTYGSNSPDEWQELEKIVKTIQLTK